MQSVKLLEAVAGRRAVSAVTGDLPMEPELLRSRAAAVAATGVEWSRSACGPIRGRATASGRLLHTARATRLVGVIFADLGPDFSLVQAMADAGFAGAMLDTAGKGMGRLTTHLGADQLARFVAACLEHRLICGLAGGLEAPDVPRLLALGPDVLGFRGALCGRPWPVGSARPQGRCPDPRADTAGGSGIGSWTSGGRDGLWSTGSSCATMS